MTFRLPGILLLLAAFPSGLLGQKATPVTFLPHWLPQAQFAGYDRQIPAYEALYRPITAGGTP
jgi:hypothetical protein